VHDDLVPGRPWKRKVGSPTARKSYLEPFRPFGKTLVTGTGGKEKIGREKGGLPNPQHGKKRTVVSQWIGDGRMQVQRGGDLFLAERVKKETERKNKKKEFVMRYRRS